jgi:hypothetical protein
MTLVMLHRDRAVRRSARTARCDLTAFQSRAVYGLCRVKLVHKRPFASDRGALQVLVFALMVVPVAVVLSARSAGADNRR